MKIQHIPLCMRNKISAQFVDIFLIFILLTFLLISSAAFGQTQHAISFDNTNDLINAGNIPLNNVSFTIECWAKREGSDEWDVIIGQGQAVASQSLHIGFRDSNVFTLGFGGDDLNTSATYTDNNWHHWAVVYDSFSKTQIIYQDGFEVAKRTAIANYSGTGDLIIGRYGPTDDLHFNGKIDELRIWNIVRTQLQIQENMNTTISGAESTLLAYYRFNQSSGSTLSDLSGNNYNGTLNNMDANAWVPSYAPIQISTEISDDDNHTLTFDGTDDVVNCGSGINLANQSFSIEFWARHIQNDIDSFIIFHGTGSVNYGLHIGFRSNNAFAFAFIGNDLNYSDSPDGQWHHWACTFDSSSKARIIYKDGVLVANDTSSSNYLGSGNLLLGEYNGSVLQYNGELDELRIWSGVRTQTQIVDNMNATLSEIDSSLLAYYQFNHSSGLTLSDLSGNNHHGTLTNMAENAWGQSYEPFQTTPVSDNENKTLTFDGTNDYVNCGNGLTLANQHFTVEFWARRASKDNSDILVIHGSNSANNGLHIGFRDTNQFTFAFNSNDLNADAGYTDNDWHHWACTFDASNQARRIYKDGVLLANDTATSNYLGSGDLIFGRYFDSNYYHYGELDELRIWNSVRTQDQIIANMHQPLFGNETDLMAYYNFDQSSGYKLVDLTGNGHDGTLYNMDDSSDWINSPVKFHGEYGPGGNFPINNLSKLKMWLKADSLTGLSNGDAISIWSDHSGYNQHALQFTTANQPQFQYSQLNGKPSLSFSGYPDGTGGADYDYLNAGQIDLSSGKKLSIFIVARLDNSSPAADQYFVGRRNGSNGYRFGNQYFQNNRQCCTEYQSDKNQPLDFTIFNMVADDSQAIVKWNGSQQGTALALSGDNFDELEEFIIGGSETNGAYSLDGSIAEIIIYDESLNQVKQNIIDNYLSAKYAISLTNDKYDGDQTDKGDYDYEVAGIGQESDSTQSFAASNGLFLMNHQFLADDGDYVLAGLSDTSESSSFTETNIPDGIDKRLDKIWYIDRTDGGASANGNIIIGFNYSELGLSQLIAAPENYSLLYKSQVSGTFSVLQPVQVTTRNNQLYFEIDPDQLNDGYYTLGWHSIPGSGNALVFDGSTEYVEIPYNESLNTEIFTVTVWAKVTGGQGAYRSVLTSRGDGTGYIIYAKDTNVWSFWIGNSSWLSIDGSPVVLNKWTHLALTCDGSKCNVYIDGIYIGQMNALSLNTSYPLRFGAGTTESTPSFYFPGEIDEFRYYNVVLSQQDIRDLMCQKLSETSSNLMAYYRFDHSSGTSLLDLSGNQINGTLMNMDNTNWVVSGAPIGDVSTHDYDGSTASDFSASLSYSDGSSFSAVGDTGTFQGIHLYRVDDAPNITTLPDIFESMSDTHYWGIYTVGTTETFSIIYDYSNHSETYRESNFKLASRLNATDNTWSDSNTTVNTTINTLTKTQISTDNESEFIFGITYSPSSIDTIPDQSAAGTVSFTITDLESGQVTITILSSNESVIPYTGFDLAGSGSNTLTLSQLAAISQNLTLAITPNANQYDYVTISILTSGSDGLTSITQFNVDLPPPGAGNALSFDGSSEYVQVPYHANLNSNIFTVSIWAKATGGSGNFRSVLTSRNGNNISGYMFYATNSNIWSFWISNGSEHLAINGSPVVLNKWTHLALTYDGSICTGYIDGVKIGQEGTFSLNTSMPLRIGAGTTETTPLYHFPGEIDEFRYYSVVLSQQDIRDVMCQKIAPNTANLMAYYRFDHDSGTTLTDLSDNNYHGTLFNMDNSNWVLSGAPIGDTSISNYLEPNGGYALTLDGVNEYVQVSMDPPETNYTYEFWFKTNDQNAGFVAMSYPSLGGGYDRNAYLSAGNICHRLWSEETICSTGQNFADNNWHHLAFVVDSSSGQKVYADGNLQASGVKGSSDFTSASSIDIGFSAGTYFNGSLDEIRLWNEVKTQADIQKLMYSPLTGNESNLLLHYNFNQQPGTTINDQSGNGTTGNAVNIETVDWVASTVPLMDYSSYHPPFGEVGLNLDGVNEYIYVPIASPETNFTYEIWFKTRLQTVGISSVRSSTHSGEFDRNIYLTGGNICQRIYSEEIICSSGQNYGDNTWHHLAIVVDLSIGRKIYVDGTVVATGAKTVSDFNWDTCIDIGYENLGAPSQPYFKGNLFEVRLWNEVRTQAQIQNTMYSTLTGNEPNLLLYLRFDRQYTTTITDLSNNGNNGQLINIEAGDWTVYDLPLFTASLSQAGGDSLTVNSESSSGVQLYLVNELPENISVDDPSYSLDNEYYWGVFPIGNSNSYTVSYNYSEDYHQDNIKLFGRYNHSDLIWSDINGTVNTDTKTLTQTNLSAFYALSVTEFIKYGYPLSINTISDQSLNENTAKIINFTLADINAQVLTITYLSSNENIVALTGMTLSGDQISQNGSTYTVNAPSVGTSVTLTITPETNQAGTAFITITIANSNGLTESESFAITVNALPVISSIEGQTTLEDTATSIIRFTATDLETASSSLILTMTSSNQTLVPDAYLLYQSNSSQYSIVATPALNQFGTTTLSVTITDADGLASSVSFNLTVTDVDDSDYSWMNNQYADVVLGQPDFSSSNSGTTISTYNTPLGVATDPTTGKVFVSDNANNRILRYSSSAAAINGSSPEVVLGQADFVSGLANRGGSVAANTFYGPAGIFVDSLGRLWVTDNGNHRVLLYDRASSKTTGANADGVLGQPNFTSGSAATSQNGMKNPSDLWVDPGGILWVADTVNYRVLRFDDAAKKSNGANADGVLGQINFVSNAQGTSQSAVSYPYGVIGDNAGNLFVADSQVHRVLRFDNAALKSNGANADGVLGQSNFVSNASGTTSSSINFPAGLEMDHAGRLIVAEKLNSRMIIFNNAINKADGASADYVIGQTNFTNNTANNGGISERTLNNLYFISFDHQNNDLWVADSINHRALRYSLMELVQPVMSPITNATMDEDTVSNTISFTVTDINEQALTITYLSSNENIISLTGITFNGDQVSLNGSTYMVNASSVATTVSLTVTPELNQSGTTFITITVTDPHGMTATESFALTVNETPDLYPPEFGAITDQNATSTPIEFTLTSTETEQLTVTVSSSDSSIVSYTGLILSGSGSYSQVLNATADATENLTLAITPMANQHARITLTIIAENSSGITSSTDFSVIVSPPGSGQALDFDGSNDYVNLGTGIADQFSAGTAITIEYWFKGSVLLSPVRIQDVSGAYIVAGWNPANPIHIISTDGDTGNGLTCGNLDYITDGKWHHLAMTWQKNTSFGYKSYLDGVLVAQRDSANVNLPVFSNDNTYIGSYGSLGEFINGQLDDVRIWNVARSQTQIQETMCQKLAGTESGLVAYYRFDHISGTTLKDLSGNSHHGTLLNMDNNDWVLSGAPIGDTSISTYLDLDAGNALTLDGVNEYVQVSINAPETNYTYELWFKTNDQNAKISMMGAPTLGSSGLDRSLYLSSGNIYHYIYNAETINSSGQNYADNEWHHVAVVVQSSVGQKIYVDGTLQASGVKGCSDFNWETSLDIGYFQAYFNGSFDEVRLWNEPKTQAEIQEFMYSTLTGNESNLLLYYNFNQQSGTTLTDLSGNGYTGNAVNIENEDWVASTVPLMDKSSYYPPFGKAGLKIDGVNEYINVPIDSPETDYTYEVWLKTWLSTVGISTVRSVSGGGDGDYDRCLYLSGGNICHRIYGEETICSSGQNFGDNAWHHVAVVVDSSTGQKIYVDGTVVASGAKTASDFNWDTCLNIGLYTEGASTHSFFHGNLFEVRLWNEVRSLSQIQSNMYRLIGNETNLLFYLRFDRQYGATITDLSGNGNNGQPINIESNDWIKFPIVTSNLSHANGDQLTANCESSSGVQLYLVNELPENISVDDPSYSLDNEYYWGVFPIGNSNSYTVSYNYSEDYHQDNIKLFGRYNHSDLIWSDINGTVNTDTKTLTQTNLSAFYALSVTEFIPFGSPLSIDTISDQPLNENTAKMINFTLADINAQVLTITYLSSNENIVALTGMTLNGDQVSQNGSTYTVNASSVGTSVTLTITPETNQAGTAFITITIANSSGTTASESFAITVNAAPVISAIPDQTTLEDIATGIISFTATDLETASSSLILTMTSSNQTLVPDEYLLYESNSGQYSIVATPALNQFGSTTISVTITDGHGLASSISFNLTVTDVDDSSYVWINNQAADVVLGQSVFNTDSSGTSSSQMNYPVGVCVDKNTGKLFVSDRANNRVLRFSSVNVAINGSVAEAVFGQADFSGVLANRGGSVAANTLSTPNNLIVDYFGRLWVVDMNNHRVLRFDKASSIESGANADVVLGQNNFTSNTSNTTQNTFYTPTDLWIDPAGSLWVCEQNNNRILRFDNAALKTNGANADGVLGQTNFTTNSVGTTQSTINQPHGIFGNNDDHLFIVEVTNHRVLRFDNASTKANGANADAVLGQTNFVSNTSATTNINVSTPLTGFMDHAGHLYISDMANQRILIFNDALNKANGASADHVLGQPGFTTAIVNNGGISARSLNYPHWIFFDNSQNHLWVPDPGNNRVLRYTMMQLTAELSDIPVQNATSTPIGFTLTDTQTEQWTVTVSSSDPSIISYTGLTLSGSGSYSQIVNVTANVTENLTLTITPLANQHDRITLTINAQNSSGITTSTDFSVIVSPPGSGNGLNFSGTTDYAYLPNHTSQYISNTFTVEFWFKAANTSQSQTYILGKAVNYWNVLYEYVDNTIEFYCPSATGSDPRPGSGIPIADTKWHHIAYSYDGSIWSGYLDGVQVFSVPLTFSIPTASTDVIYLGAAGPSLGAVAMHIDEFRLWSIGRSANEIRSTMCSTLTGQETGLVGYYRFDHISGTTITDLSDTGNDGVMVNMDNADWILSGASLGDASAFDYTGTTPNDFSASIASSNGDTLTATGDGGTYNGIQLYYVNESSNVSNSSNGCIYENYYWGVFPVGTSPTYQVVYDYNGNSHINGSVDINLLNRLDNADNTWIIGLTSQDNISKTVTQNTIDPTSVKEFYIQINHIPEIGSISNQTIDENSSLESIPITATDSETADCSLSLTFASSNTSLFASDSFSYTCDSGTYYFSLAPITGQAGNSNITITVTDAGSLSASTSFALTVVSLGQILLTDISAQNSTSDSIGFTLIDSETGQLTVTVSSSDLSIISYTGISLSGSGSYSQILNVTADITENLTLTITPMANQHDRITLTIVAENSIGITSSTDFSVIVSPPGSGNALNFDGVNDYIDVPYHEDLNPDIFTVSVWAKVEGGSGGFRSVLSSRNYNLHQGYTFYANDSNIWSFWVGTGTTTASINCEGVVLNQWTHLALTYDGSQFVGYINGKPQTLTSTFSKNTSIQLRIGAGEPDFGTPNFLFPGKIDELRVYQSVLTQEEIRDEMCHRLTGTEDDLNAYYRFDHSSGTILEDLTARGNNGSLINMDNNDWIVSTAPIGDVSTHTYYDSYTYSLPGSGKALNFDGVNDYVDLGTRSGLILGNTFTIEAWIYPTPSDSGYRGFIGNHQGVPTTRSPSMWLFNYTGIHYDSYDQSNTRCTAEIPNVVSSNQWYHIAYVFDGTNVNLYINGINQHSSSSCSGFNLKENPIKFIGKVDGFFMGSIDEVRLWNVARTESQIQNKMNTKLLGNETGLMGYYRFDSISGNTLYDSSVNAYHGTMTNMSTGDWVDSGDILNDADSYAVSLTVENRGTITAKSYDGTFKSMHLYVVNAPPNSTLIEGVSLDSTHYFGVFTTGTNETYSLTYNYSDHPIISLEDTFMLAYRANNADSTWENLTTTVNTIANTVAKTNLSMDMASEFILGFNYSPTITSVSNQSTNENTVIQSIALTATDIETADCSLDITFGSSDTSLVSVDNISYTCDSGIFYISLTPTTDQSGNTIISITLVDAGSLTASTSFDLTVNSINYRPIIGTIADQTTNRNTILNSISLTATDDATAVCSIGVTYSSSNTNLIPIDSISYTCSSDILYFSLTPATDQYGSTQITITITDAEGLTATESFAVTVNNVSSVAETTFNFTTCGAVGRDGPDQSQIDTTYDSGSTLYDQVTGNSGIQEW
ncbi:Pentaxin, partial [Candidatus Magnetomorum sp. HK-1]